MTRIYAGVRTCVTKLILVGKRNEEERDKNSKARNALPALREHQSSTASALGLV
jgi:hypothetical protein